MSKAVTRLPGPGVYGWLQAREGGLREPSPSSPWCRPGCGRGTRSCRGLSGPRKPGDETAPPSQGCKRITGGIIFEQGLTHGRSVTLGECPSLFFFHILGRRSAYGPVYKSYVHSLIDFFTHIHLCNHHLDRDPEHSRFFQSTPLLPVGDQSSDLCWFRLILLVFEPPVNGVLWHIRGCLPSFAQRNALSFGSASWGRLVLRWCGFPLRQGHARRHNSFRHPVLPGIRVASICSGQE